MAFGPRIVDREVVLRAAVVADRDACRALGIDAEIARMFGGDVTADRAMTAAAATRSHGAAQAPARRRIDQAPPAARRPPPGEPKNRAPRVDEGR